MEEFNFEYLKEIGNVYTIDKNGKITLFNLKLQPKILFDVDGKYFSDGWGGHWNYSDFGVTWANNRTILMDRFYNDFQKNNVKLLNILHALNAPEHQIELIKAYLFGYYGTLWGGTVEQGLTHYSNSEIDKFGNLYEIIGMPGPDIVEFKPENYGVTWALTEEELKKET